MGNLVIKHKIHSAFRKGMGIFTIFLGVIWIVIYLIGSEWWRGLFGLLYIGAEKGLKYENRYHK